MSCVLAVVLALLVLSGIVPAFFMGWPWWWIDRRKMAKYLAECGHGLVEMKGQWWTKWDRVDTWRWIPVREYTVRYIDQAGLSHQARAEFYLPWWLNKSYDSGLVENFDLVEEDISAIHE